MVKPLLDGRIALITGAGGGLGLAIARRFAEEGAQGLGVDLDDPSEVLPEAWFGAAADVTREGDMEQSFTAAKAHFGRLDVVVANAGLVPAWSTIEDLDLAEWDRVFAVNVRGVAATLKHAVPLMKQHGGSIIVMGSLNSWHAHPSQTLYTATKHAVLGIVRAAAADLGRYGIRVNALGPGPIATQALLSRVGIRATLAGARPEEELDTMAQATHLRRIATQADVAATALFLASNLSAAQTGHLIPVDCGMA